MPIKNVGSKLTRGVRQLKAQQESTPPVEASIGTPNRVETESVTEVKARRAVAADKPATPEPAQENTRKSGVQHPERVWPD